MAFKCIALIVCTVALTCHAQSYEQFQRLRQPSAPPRGRLNNFPTNVASMQTIYYPGSAGDPPQYIEPEEPEELQEPIFSLPPVPPTTTPYPIIVETRRPIPARPVIPTAPIEPVSIPRATIRAPPRRRRPQAPVQTRFESHSDIPVVENIENTEPLAEDDDEEARIFRQQQAENAHYTFDTSIDDTINDHAIQRQETRNGLSLKGMYSYSDGFFKRTIHYEADKNGYRVVKEEIEPIGEGPQYNPDGRADVSTSLHGNQNKYTITADDFVRGRDTPASKKTAHRFSHRV